MSNKRVAVRPDGPPSVEISTRGAARLKAGHVWVYRSDIVPAKGVPAGALVRVTDARGKILGMASYSSSSQIALRMISRDPVADLPALVSARIRAAISYRERIVEDSDAYRVVFSEADSLPGLIVDRYGDVVSVQILTQAMDAEPVRSALVETLVEELKPAGIVERVDARIRELEQLPTRQSGLLWGEQSSSVIAMNGVRFHYDGLEGQMTGAFLYQQGNFAAGAQIAHGGALYIFCYQVVFSQYLAAKATRGIGEVPSIPS